MLRFSCQCFTGCLTEIKKFFIRILWFGDVDAANVADGGLITNGVDIEYFDLLDGYFKQLQVAVTSKGELLVTIAQNDKASKNAQMELSGEDAYSILEKMYFAAPIAMRSSGKMRFLVTQSVADGYTKYLQGKNLESTYKNTVDGLSALKFQGVDVIPMPIWDEMIQSYQDKGATFYAVSASVCHICRSLLGGVDTPLTVSTMLHGEYGVDDVCVSLLNIVGDGQVKSKLLLPLNDEEIAALHKSADALKAIIKDIEIKLRLFTFGIPHLSLTAAPRQLVHLGSKLADHLRIGGG